MLWKRYARWSHSAGALVLNIGTLNKGQVESMILAGGIANDQRIPVILDPVGSGCDPVQDKRTALLLIDELRITILKGNAGEIGGSCRGRSKRKGVDSCGMTGDPVTIARKFADARGSPWW